jgi:uncharacterized alkaline shock family protein YloU
MSRVFRGHRSANGVDIDIEDGAVTIDVYMVALPNMPLLPVGQAVQSAVYRAISDVVGMPVRAVNIHFEDVQDPYEAPGPPV